jgi:starch synthase
VALITDILRVTNLEYLKDIKTLFTIHNFRYQGKTDVGTLSTGNLRPESLKSLSIDAVDGDINFMAQGVLNADLINTVSPTYAKEITTSIYGAGLDNVIKKRKEDLYGILNGIDTGFFNPRTDKYIPHNFGISTLGNKKKNKASLQKKLNLPVDDSRPLVGMVTRLVWQKGIDLITERFSKLRCQFVFLGTGQKEYEDHLKKLAKKYPDQFSVNIEFDLGLAQEIYAASDMFLMASRFEPCGLGQMIAMRYGTIPVVRATGGLKDTVTEDLGFSFKNVSKTEFWLTLKKALDVYYENPDKWQEMVKKVMKEDFSWDKSAKEYVKIYKKLA